MKKKFPRGIAVVNRPGAGGSISAAEIVQSKPDGYTFGLVAFSNLVIHPQTNDLPYKGPDDYAPFINVVSYYPLIVVRADAPWRTGQEFIAHAKSNPGKIRVGTPGEGTTSHLNLEELRRVSGANLTHVPFAGSWSTGRALTEATLDQPGKLLALEPGGKNAIVVLDDTCLGSSTSCLFDRPDLAEVNSLSLATCPRRPLNEEGDPIAEVAFGMDLSASTSAGSWRNASCRHRAGQPIYYTCRTMPYSSSRHRCKYLWPDR